LTSMARLTSAARPRSKGNRMFRSATNRGDQLRADYQKLYDERIQVALKYLGE
jgi:hypothetical protein